MSQQTNSQQPDNTQSGPTHPEKHSSRRNGHLSYPLMENAAESLHAASGRSVRDIDLDAVASGTLSTADLQIGAETLRAQAEIARRAGYRELSANLIRAAELTAVPNEELLRMYEMLRPGRATFAELTAIAEQLEHEYDAAETAVFVREAAQVYQSRRLLRREQDRPSA